MARQRNKTNKEYSILSDEQLLAILKEDYKRCPLEFSTSGTSGITDTKSFLKNTSARTIEPILKWL
ncbi:MAG: hypothetical protein NC095_04235 [Muribaculum sp.]|nr:hypothetical protein [Muribaculum sp.]